MSDRQQRKQKLIKVGDQWIADRRQRPTPLLSSYWLRGRRQELADGSRDLYVDRYTKTEWLLVAGVLVLTVADIILTVQHIEGGGQEANPLMAWTLEQGIWVFALVRALVPLLALFVLLVHIRFRGVRLYLWALLALSLALVAYHVVLRWGLSAPDFDDSLSQATVSTAAGEGRN